MPATVDSRAAAWVKAPPAVVMLAPPARSSPPSSSVMAPSAVALADRGPRVSRRRRRRICSKPAGRLRRHRSHRRKRCSRRRRGAARSRVEEGRGRAGPGQELRRAALRDRAARGREGGAGRQPQGRIGEGESAERGKYPGIAERNRAARAGHERQRLEAPARAVDIAQDRNVCVRWEACLPPLYRCGQRSRPRRCRGELSGRTKSPLRPPSRSQHWRQDRKAAAQRHCAQRRRATDGAEQTDRAGQSVA